MAELVMYVYLYMTIISRLTNIQGARLRPTLAIFPGHESGVGSSPTLIIFVFVLLFGFIRLISMCCLAGDAGGSTPLKLGALCALAWTNFLYGG